MKYTIEPRTKIPSTLAPTNTGGRWVVPAVTALGLIAGPIVAFIGGFIARGAQ